MKYYFLAELIKSNQENSLLNQQVIKLRNELDDCKSQLVVDSMTLESTFEVEKRKAEEEIATLQRLVHGIYFIYIFLNGQCLYNHHLYNETFLTETVEESSSTRSLYDTELTKLQAYIQTLNKEIVDLKREKSQSQSPHHISQVSIKKRSKITSIDSSIYTFKCFCINFISII